MSIEWSTCHDKYEGLFMSDTFRIGISSDFKTDAPGQLPPVLAELVDPLPHVEYSYYEQTGVDEQGAYLTPDDIAEYDALLVLGSRVTPATFQRESRLSVIARWGVGYDNIHVPACTAHDVVLAITVDAVRRPVAEAVMTLLLALAKCLPAKDRAVREARWDLRGAAPAVGLRGKTLGSVGLGNIGSEVFRLAEPFGFGRKLAADPYADPAHAATLGVELVDLETVFRESDFVTINAFLSDATYHLVNAERLSLMKPTAYLINTARGPIVNQADLVAALEAGRLAGAGLDVFEEEPLPADHPLTHMDNVILAPHSLAWTDDLYVANGVGACESILSVFQGNPPKYPVNRDVLEQSGFRARLAQNQTRWSAAAGVTG
jgi:phosphoglycerate dehydrogenase-like enzyme